MYVEWRFEPDASQVLQSIGLCSTSGLAIRRLIEVIIQRFAFRPVVPGSSTRIRVVGRNAFEHLPE